MLDRSTIWPYEDGKPGEFYYQRYAHPAGAEAERALGELEGGHALLFPSGSGATTALLLTFLESGRTVAIAKDAYYGTPDTHAGTRALGAPHGRVRPDRAAPPEGIDLVWLESPSNPLLTLPDLDAASAHPAPVVVDSTASTPVYLRPLEQGADFVLHSATKFLGGHHDVLLGAVVCKSRDDYEQLLQFRSRSGSLLRRTPPGFCGGAWRRSSSGCARHTENATEIARRLEAHPAVERVRYPGFGGLLQLRRGRRSGCRAARRAVGPDDQERHEPRRDTLGARDPGALGRGPRPGKPRPPERRARGRRGDLGRSGAGVRALVRAAAARKITPPSARSRSASRSAVKNSPHLSFCILIFGA